MNTIKNILFDIYEKKSTQTNKQNITVNKTNIGKENCFKVEK